MIDRVTITGADDSVEPIQLLPYSDEFPFVEWGILFGSRSGPRPRFPSNRWITRLARLAKTEDILLSAHLCGSWVRNMAMRADHSWSKSYSSEWPHFQRIQLNFHGQQHEPCTAFYDLLRDGKQYIFQVDGVNDGIIVKATKPYRGIDACPLYDLSGGAGIVPDTWPRPLPETYCGYAGGLGPDNLKEQIERILRVTEHARIWIDMETKVRSSDDSRFDLSKVRTCLEIAKGYMLAQNA